MADGLNRVMLLGNLGADPELKHTQGGQAILKLRIATSESYLDRDKKRQERTEWHTVTMWGPRGEALAKFLEKGRTIFVEGRLQTRSWEDKDGGKRYATEVVATNIVLAGGGQRGGQRRDDSGGGDGYGSDHGGDAGGDFGDDDIPF